ncbi:MAG: triose-phosphate isomerase [Spirochaetaceae bacterium]|jgi:triosephosphate isomerase|nr:triose-phosphate isomerase [Spirochaetaceae bacterium]
MARKYFIAGNWKMHKTRAEAAVLARELVAALKDGRHKYLIAPGFTTLETVAALIKDSNILLGAQNCAVEEQGAHTGEVSVLQLKDLGVQTVILGHSERRHIYKEDDGLINRKVRLALKHGLDVILCVGELLEEREDGRAEAVCKRQTVEGLKGISADDFSRVTIAYEPVWAIGTGKTATPEDADAIHAYIRKVIGELYGSGAAESVIIQYGGSVKPDNAAALMAKENIDGALVGGASLESGTFVPIAKFS